YYHTPPPNPPPPPLHDALPIFAGARQPGEASRDRHRVDVVARHVDAAVASGLRVEADRADLVAERRPVEHDPVHDERAERDEERSEEHTSELQSLAYLVCRLLL